MMQWNQLISSQRKRPSALRGEAAFEQDYQTILNSSLFRRLQDKTQAFPMEQDDYIRTHLTHSLEVSAVAGKLGEDVFCRLKEQSADPFFRENSSGVFRCILMSAGLIHDIGNPPYGHFGEYTIREWMRENLGRFRLDGTPVTELLSEQMLADFCHYEGNAQGLRLLSKCPHLGQNDGLNLTYSVLESMIKYPVCSSDIGPACPKVGYFFSEQELFLEMNRTLGLDGHRHPLSYLLEAADDIAYRASDLEDAMVKKILTLSDILHYLPDPWRTRLHQLWEEELSCHRYNAELTALQRWNLEMKGALLRFAEDSFLCHYAEILDGSFSGELFGPTDGAALIQAITEISEQMIYVSKDKIKSELFGRKVIQALLEQFIPAAVEFDTGRQSDFIDRRIIDVVSGFYKTMYRHHSDGRSGAEKLYLRIMMITDFIAGMTDHYARNLYEQIC